MNNYYFSQSAGSTFRNAVGATIDLQGDGTWAADRTSTISNLGTFQKSAGTGTNEIQAIFNNEGAIDATSGILQFDGGGTENGTLNVDAGAALEFVGNSAFAINSPITGAGTVINSSGAGAGPALITANVAGTLTIGSNSIVDIEGNVTVGGLVLNGGILTGAGTVTVTGQTVWSSGTMSGPGKTIAAGGLLLGAGTGGTAYQYLVGRTLENAGAAIWLGPNSFTQGADSSFVNDANRTLEIVGDGTWSAGGYLVNQGAITKSTGSGTMEIQAYLINSGSVKAQSGMLEFDGGGSVTGSLAADTTGAALEFNKVFAFNTGANVGGPGSVAFLGGTVSFASGATFAPTGTSLFAGNVAFAHNATVGQHETR